MQNLPLGQATYLVSLQKLGKHVIAGVLSISISCPGVSLQMRKIYELLTVKMYVFHETFNSQQNLSCFHLKLYCLDQ